MKAFIVDDDGFIRQTLRVLLSELKIQVVGEAINGQDALTHLGVHDVDVVFLDIVMPGMSGMEVLQQITRLKPNVKVIMISSEATKETVQEAIKQGAAGFVAKPFSANMVIKNLNAILKK